MKVELTDNEQLEIIPETVSEALALKYLFGLEEDFCDKCNTYPATAQKIIIHTRLKED